jgi:predicted dienelactone hydrolase
MQPNASAAIDPQHVALVEAVRGSDIPVRLMYVELIDGVYAPIGLRVPHGQGPFPLVMFAAGNGGGGMAMVRDYTQNVSWTQEQFLKAGYAVVWLRYRAEVDYAYDKIGKLIVDIRQRRQLLNRGPMEYEDVIAIADYLKTLPEIDGNRIGYMGMSHGGEMALKIASEYHGIKAMVANEPAAHEFLRLKPDNTARINPATGLLDVEKMLMREARCARASPKTSPPNASVRSRHRSSCRAATATNCRASSASATTCSPNSARTPSGKPTSTTSTASATCTATTRAITRRTPCRLRW